MDGAKRKLIENFQCPGCVCGSDTECEKFKPYEDSGGCFYCENHVLGTSILGIGNFAPGLPKGFNRPGYEKRERSRNTMDIRLWLKGEKPKWDDLNIAVWAAVEDGFLFVRTVLPRLAIILTDVIEGGDLSMVPRAINVTEKIAEMD